MFSISDKGLNIRSGCPNQKALSPSLTPFNHAKGMKSDILHLPEWTETESSLPRSLHAFTRAKIHANEAQ